MSPSPLFLGIEIGGTKLQLGLGHGDGLILELRRLAVAPSEGAPGILAQIASEFGKLGVARGDLSAVGIGFGGPVDAARGVVTTSHQVPGWDGFPLADWAREKLGVPTVSVHNDADTAALAEARFGAGVGLSPILYVTIGSGIGGGLILDGKIYRGAGAGAVEIGHLRIQEPDPGGYHGLQTLESIASGWSIGTEGRVRAEKEVRDGWDVGGLARYAGGDPSRVTPVTVAEAARRNPYGSGSLILRRATTAMVQALAQAVTLLAPRRIILGGGVSQIDEDLWLDPIRLALEERVFPPFRGTYDVVPAALGEEVVVHGALALARDARGPRD